MFSESKIKQIRKRLYDIKNPKNLSKSKIKEIEKIFLNLKKVFLSQTSIMIMMIMDTEE